MRVFIILLVVLGPGGVLAQADKVPEIADRLVEETEDICVSRCCVINKRLICIKPSDGPPDPTAPVLMTDGRHGLPLNIERMKQFMNDVDGVNR